MGNCPRKCRDKPASLEPPVAPSLVPSSSAGALESNLVVSLQDYPCYTDALSMRLGERLSVVSNDGDFMMVKSVRTGHEIYVPTEYTAMVVNRWLFKGLGRGKAEELLMQSHNRMGAFIVRESESQPQDHYSLSILKRPESYLGSVKHYRISRLQNGWFYISQRLTFSSLENLVQHYTEFADGLCCTLEEPCFILGSDNITPSSSTTQTTSLMPLTIRRPSISWKDISRSMLFRGNRVESEHSLVSEGLREAISSYLYMTEGNEQEIR